MLTSLIHLSDIWWMISSRIKTIAFFFPPNEPSPKHFRNQVILPSTSVFYRWVLTFSPAGLSLSYVNPCSIPSKPQGLIMTRAPMTPNVAKGSGRFSVLIPLNLSACCTQVTALLWLGASFVGGKFLLLWV